MTISPTSNARPSVIASNFEPRQREVPVARAHEPGEQLRPSPRSPAGRRESAGIIAHEQNQGGGCRRRLSGTLSRAEIRAARRLRAGGRGRRARRSPQCRGRRSDVSSAVARLPRAARQGRCRERGHADAGAFRDRRCLPRSRRPRAGREAHYRNPRAGARADRARRARSSASCRSATSSASMRPSSPPSRTSARRASWSASGWRPTRSAAPT